MLLLFISNKRANWPLTVLTPSGA